MQDSRIAFGRPFNWCDRCCERCPLAEACPLARDDLDQLLARAEPDCELFDADLQPQPDSPPYAESPRARRSTSLGIELVVTLANAEGERTAAAAVDRELMRSALTLAMKVARVSGYFEPRSAEAWAADAVPNLLLVERLITSVREGLTGLWQRGSVAMKAEELLGELENLLAPLVRSVDARSRESLASLMAAGQAPSPFCTRPFGTRGRPVLCSPK